MLWMLTLASVGRFTLFPDAAARLAGARLVTRLSRGRVLLHCAVDDHLHVVLRDTRFGAGRLGGNLHKHLTREDLSLQATHVKAVADRRHLMTLVAYVLHQPVKHGLRESAAAWEGSCFPDLVGARILPGTLEPLSRELPRLRDRELLEPVGLARMPRPLPWREVAQAGLPALNRAVAAAAGLAEVDTSHTEDQIGARRTLAFLARRAGIPLVVVAEVLGVGTRSMRRIAASAEDGPAVQAARTWLDLEHLARGDRRSD